MDSQMVLQNILANPSENSHIVQIYQDEKFQLAGITRYLTSGLLNGGAIIFIATRTLRESVISEMDKQNIDIQSAKHTGQIKFFDAKLLLSNLIIDNKINDDAFSEFIGGPIRAARLKYGRVRALSELTDFLWRKEKHDIATRFENLWNELFLTEKFLLLCTYFTHNFEDPAARDNILNCICKHHTHQILPQEDPDASQTRANNNTVLNLFRPPNKGRTRLN